MSERMDRAMASGAGLWTKSVVLYPDFVASYLGFSEELLLSKAVVRGDEFRAYCGKRGLKLPEGLNHNVWVSGPKALEKLGWIEKIGIAEPTKMHNHMQTVTLWRSLLYVEKPTRRGRTKCRTSRIA